MEILRIYREEQLLINYCMTKHLILLKNPKYGVYHCGLASIFYKFFGKSSGANTSATCARSEKLAGRTVKSEIMSNQKLDEELLENLKNEK